MTDDLTEWMNSYGSPELVKIDDGDPKFACKLQLPSMLDAPSKVGNSNDKSSSHSAEGGCSRGITAD
jgi:hypothetical protein